MSYYTTPGTAYVPQQPVNPSARWRRFTRSPITYVSSGCTYSFCKLILLHILSVKFFKKLWAFAIFRNVIHFIISFFVRFAIFSQISHFVLSLRDLRVIIQAYRAVEPRFSYSLRSLPVLHRAATRQVGPPTHTVLLIRCLCAGTGCKKQRVARTFRSAFCPKNVAKSKMCSANSFYTISYGLAMFFVVIF